MQTNKNRELDALNLPDFPSPGPRILALDPGLKHTGFVLLRGEKILAHGVWHLGDGQRVPTRRKVRERISSYLSEFEPDELVLEWPAPIDLRRRKKHCRTFRRLFHLAEAIEQASKARGIPSYHYDPNTIRRVVVGDGWATKEQVASLLAFRYPELYIYLKQDRRWKEIHWRHMFDALAAAQCHMRLCEEAA